ncbi:hypothetical protein [Staphylococcus chromogenes]|uniref:hypothetical protein n=1 Tax=Staphylococcus chromogenes TaxID=46126 RepID=UPI0028839A1E|nr:hypothetical protein [Staphylococcus chromogenes]MDT0700401.1 hypothetical protein [Staphylococcus chromogenes]
MKTLSRIKKYYTNESNVNHCERVYLNWEKIKDIKDDEYHRIIYADILKTINGYNVNVKARTFKSYNDNKYIYESFDHAESLQFDVIKAPTYQTAINKLIDNYSRYGLTYLNFEDRKEFNYLFNYDNELSKHQKNIENCFMCGLPCVINFSANERDILNDLNKLIKSKYLCDVQIINNIDDNFQTIWKLL